MDKNISYYSHNAENLAELYNSVEFETVHNDWLEHIPEHGMALDVGAGSGRDARYLASKGLSVVAVEPATELNKVAQSFDCEQKIHWISDSLPELSEVFKLQVKFDLILLSAVWMHIAPSHRNRCIRKLSSLLKPSGKIVISLRRGQCDDERVMYDVSSSELAKLASQFGLSYKPLTNIEQSDKLGRSDVSWQTVLLQLPDDGTGAFPLIRNIVVNDSKSSTYKFALLRSLLRIAEGHPGAVIEQTEQYTVLPMGLVALYWLKLYKPLIDKHQMQQNSNSGKGLGFVNDNGWNQLTSLTSNDFYIGATYADFSQQLYQTIKDISSTIKKMPVKHTKLPNGKETVFEVELNTTSKPKGNLTLDFEFMSSIGKFYVPRHIWDSLTRFSVWIEPALVNEWANLMSGFGLNRDRNMTKIQYLEALSWEDPARTTSRVRKRVDELLNLEKVLCCWSGSPIRTGSYSIDHAFPFARWPNNDLWNLLPTRSIINSKKSVKLPTSGKISIARDFITSWWEQGWENYADEFFTQANFALPNLSPANRSYDDVFEAFLLQRDRIKDFQQLTDW